MTISDFTSVRLGPESLTEALDHDIENLDLQSGRPGKQVETDARLSEADPDSSVTGGRASKSIETSDVATNTVVGKLGEDFDAVPDAPQTSSPSPGGASNSFDGLPDIPSFLDRRRSVA
jgi:hypothetical protein